MFVCVTTNTNTHTHTHTHTQTHLYKVRAREKRETVRHSCRTRLLRGNTVASNTLVHTHTCLSYLSRLSASVPKETWSWFTWANVFNVVGITIRERV